MLVCLNLCIARQSHWSFMNYVKPCLNQIVDNLDIALQHRFVTETKIYWGHLPYACHICLGLFEPEAILDLQSSSPHVTQGLAHKCGFPTHTALSDLIHIGVLYYEIYFELSIWCENCSILGLSLLYRISYYLGLRYNNTPLCKIHFNCIFVTPKQTLMVSIPHWPNSNWRKSERFFHRSPNSMEISFLSPSILMQWSLQNYAVIWYKAKKLQQGEVSSNSNCGPKIVGERVPRLFRHTMKYLHRRPVCMKHCMIRMSINYQLV